jgi:hypothetical protein
MTYLKHEVLDHTVENRSFISKSLLASCEGAKILYCLGNTLSVETHDNPTCKKRVALRRSNLVRS